MHPFVILLARLALSAVWIFAAVAKLARKESRGEVVSNFGLLSGRAAEIMGECLPYAELTLGLLLLAGKWTLAAAAASVGLLVIFSLAILISLIQGRKVECNCFGQFGRGEITWLTLGRNLLLQSLAVLVMCANSEYLSLDGLLHGTAVRAADPPPAEFVPVFFTALAGVLIYVAAVSAWGTGRAIARAESGPALATREQQVLRRWMRLDANAPSGGG